ncbi:RNA polymerase sigma factor SigX [Oceanobacillus massiliensis]|uniref:RNA polymerase sigma factor SigX n=1 Tax=Oceanobacillus massiliensis TaxID=1465765 RepID=UPI000288BEAC|nr:RNA polymerase sigma factor SigX [Oceanobacillus massiliensis]
MKAVFDSLYDNYHQDMFQYIYYMVKDKETTEDLVQEVYIKVLKSYENFKGQSSEKTWLFSIARHVTYDYFRSVKRKRNRILDFFNWEEKGEMLPAENDLPEELAVKNEQIKQVYYYLDKCTIDQKSVLILRYLQSFSIQETAEILNFSVSKVKTTQHRGLKTLKRLMLDEKEKGGDIS